MEPALLPGERLVIVGWATPRLGDLVAVRDPRQLARVMVKRVAAVDAVTGALTVLGDNAAESTDSRSFGPLDCDLYLGRAVYRYAPRARAGWLRRRVDGGPRG